MAKRLNDLIVVEEREKRTDRHALASRSPWELNSQWSPTWVRSLVVPIGGQNRKRINLPAPIVP